MIGKLSNNFHVNHGCIVWNENFKYSTSFAASFWWIFVVGQWYQIKIALTGNMFALDTLTYHYKMASDSLSSVLFIAIIQYRATGIGT